MDIDFHEPAYPSVWLLKGSLTHNGARYTFWYEYDERDGATNYELSDSAGHYDMPDDLDYDAFEAACQAQLEKSWPIVHHLPKVA
jgi:hypothetical protein